MQKRVQQIWIPGILALTLSMIFLMTLQKLGFSLASWGAART